MKDTKRKNDSFTTEHSDSSSGIKKHKQKNDRKNEMKEQMLGGVSDSIGKIGNKIVEIFQYLLALFSNLYVFLKEKFDKQKLPNSASKDETLKTKSMLESNEENRPRRVRSKKEQYLQLAKTFYFPILIIYLQLIFHIYMKISFKYVLIFVGFSYVLGMILSIIVNNLPKKAKQITTSILSLIICVLFCVEVVCKDILQQYYPLFSAVETAAGNHLTDYWKAIASSLLKNIPGFVLMLVIPGFFCAYLLFHTRERRVSGKMKKRIFVAMTMRTAIVYLALISVVKLFPWKNDFSPKVVYASDTNIDEQVEQFGVLTMVWLDGKHSLFGVSRNSDVNMGDLEKLAEKENKKSKKVDASPNVMDLDFKAVADSSSNKDVKWLSEYFESAIPTNKNKYTGMFKDYNIIFVTAEGLTGYMIDKETTPTLYKLTHEGFHFKNFYSALHFTSTSGGEWQNLTGLYPKNGFPISMTESGEKKTNLYFTLANRLGDLGYTATGYHYNQNMYGRELSHPNLGYNWRQADKCDEPIVKEKRPDGKEYWPQSDDYMIEDSIDDYINSEKPFHVYYLTLSGHLPYGYNSNAMSLKNKDAVANLSYSEKTNSYIAAGLELEKGMKRLIDELEKAGKADNTLIVMAPDHIPYGDVDVIEELAGKSMGKGNLENLKEQDIDFDVYRNSLVVWSASMKEQFKEPVEVDKVCCQVDVLPTLLNLLGVEYDSRLLSGSDILSDSEGMVVFSSHCWLTDKGFYNRFTGEFKPAKGVEMNAEEQESYISSRKTLATCKTNLAPMIVDTNYYDLLFNK